MKPLGGFGTYSGLMAYYCSNRQLAGILQTQNYANHYVVCESHLEFLDLYNN